ncbi:MFS transporter [Palleronia sediminis]|uniref:MFS transporter n=1 Tax=Palleronia sediminis TaxID=2547833 RepID=A0A4V3BAS1_9RHOB|nr:MFS transporter [Palleronia sediminis]TDL84159.1 MFS transporter [Palleronia sediminis]
MRGGTRWGLILAVFVAGLLGAGQFAKIALALPATAEAYGLPVAGIAFLVSITGIVGIAAGALAGGVVAALGPRRVMLGALWSGAALSLVQVALPPLWLMTLLRIAEGVSHLGIVVAGPTLIAAAAGDRDRPVAMGIWAMFFGLAFAAAAILVPPLVAAGGLAAVFALHAGAMALLAAILAAMTARQARRPLVLRPVAVHAAIYGRVDRALPGACFVFYTFLFVALIALLPDLLGRPGLGAVLPLLNLAGTFAGGWASRHRAPAAVMAVGFVLSGVSAMALWAGWGPALWVMFAATGLVPGGAFAAIPHYNLSSADRALATGGIAQMGNVGTTLGTPVLAMAAMSGGMAGVWGVTLAVSVAGLVATLALAARAGRAGTTAAPAH